MNRDGSSKDPKVTSIFFASSTNRKPSGVPHAEQKGRSAIGRKGGTSGDYDDWTVADLRGKAKEIGLTGYSKLTKAKLIDALRNS